MIHILFKGGMQMPKEKPDEHGVTSMMDLPRKCSTGDPDRSGGGINKVVEQIARARKKGDWS